MENFKSGFFFGTGNDINISLGWVPDRVEIFNYTDANTKDVGFPSIKVIPFTSGGIDANTDDSEIKAGHKIIGATSKATALVLAVMADTGTWAGANAAGNIIVATETITDGPFQTESVYYDGSDGTDDASVTVDVYAGYDTDTEVAGATDIEAYLGTTTLAKGFKFLAASNTDAKMFIWSAWRNAKG